MGDLLDCAGRANGERPTKDLFNGHSRERASVLLPAPQPVDFLSVDFERIRPRLQRFHILFQLLTQIIRQEDDVHLPCVVER